MLGGDIRFHGLGSTVLRFQGRPSSGASGGRGKSAPPAEISPAVGDTFRPVAGKRWPYVDAALGKRLDALDKNKQGLRQFILEDIEGFTQFVKSEGQANSPAKASAQPALIALREALKKQLPIVGTPTELDEEILTQFDQAFKETVNELKLVLADPDNAFENDFESLLELLKGGAILQDDKPLNAKTLYEGMFQAMLAGPDPQPQDYLQFKLYQFVQRFMNLPEEVKLTVLGDVALMEKMLSAEAEGEEDDAASESSVRPKFHLQPDFYHMPEFERLRREVVQSIEPRPGVLLGHMQDQRDLFIQLALDPTFKGLAFGLNVANEDDVSYVSFWDAVPVAGRVTVSSQHPMVKPNPVSALREYLGKIEAQLPANHKALMLITGKEELQPLFNHLPEIAQAYPNIKLVAATDSLPTELAPEASHQMAVVPVAPPTVMDSLIQFPLDPKVKEAVGLIALNNHVIFSRDVINEMMTQLTKSAGGRPPSNHQVLEMLELLAQNVRTKLGPQSGPAPIELEREMVIQFVNARHAELDALQTQGHNAGGGFFKFVRNTGVFFDDIKGQPEAVKAMQRVIKLMKENPRNLPIPKLLILEGSSGTGKTMSAAAFAQEAGVNFITLSASSLIDGIVGHGARHVREVFDAAEKHQPAMIFIDEIDAIARKRVGASDGGQEIEATLNELLVQLDGLSKRQGVTVAVATNFFKGLDDAFVSRSRRVLNFKLPTTEERAATLQSHQKKVNYSFAPDVDMTALAQKADGLSQRDLMQVIQNAVDRADEEESDVTQAILSEELTKRLEAVKKQVKKRTIGFHGDVEPESPRRSISITA